jgi:serine/threonine-protein kinase
MSGPEHVTFLQPGAPDAAHAASSGLPVDLVRESAARLRSLALVYALIFFLAGILPALLITADRAQFLGSFRQWGPAVIGITAALIVAALIRSPRLSPAAVTNIGLTFEVAGSYAIAAAEFADPLSLETHRGFLGLSWVAVWTVLFTVVVPTAPRRAILVALASVSAVPGVIGFVIVSGATSLHIAPEAFFLGLVFPYLLVVGMAYAGARVVYHLGSEVKRARELGSYRLEEKLGEGGMGEVWRARHRLLARPAAIKLIRPAVAGAGGVGATDEAVRRFEREAQVIARLRSPHTVELFDFGFVDDAFYYVMELLDGLDAHSFVRRFGPTPAARAIFLLRQVCHSLSEAQSHGLVHRDIKPANIFICRNGEEYDFVKVLDFGIVRAVRDAAETGPALTREHTVQGTPAFMAPEQALGADVDGRADIYATGCVAYWLLTGQTVFVADSPMALLVHHAQTTPAPPSAQTELPIPAGLDDLVLACLAKDPARRPQSAKELSRRLADVQCADSWTLESAQEWWAAHQPALQ